MFDATVRQAQLGAVTLSYVDTGGAGPVALLLHGFPEFWWSWAPQIEALHAAGYRVIAPNQRGYQGSSKPPRVADYHVDHLVADVIGLLDHLGVARCHLVGHDWGAMVAWWVANDHPERVLRLVICDVPHPVRFLEGLRTWRQLKRSWYVFYFQLPYLPERALSARNFKPIARLFKKDVRHPERWPEGAFERYREAFADPGTCTAAVNWYRAALRNAGTVVRRARRIDIPTLVVWGRYDSALGLELAAPPPHLVTDARVVVLDASHWIQHDAPDELNALLLEHLGSADERAEATSTAT